MNEHLKTDFKLWTRERFEVDRRKTQMAQDFNYVPRQLATYEGCIFSFRSQGKLLDTSTGDLVMIPA